MTPDEIQRALRRSAQVCVEQGRICWSAIDVCMADGTAEAAEDFADDSDSGFADTPAQAANFLLFVAEAVE